MEETDKEEDETEYEWMFDPPYTGERDEADTIKA